MFRRRANSLAEEDPLLISPSRSPDGLGSKARRPRGATCSRLAQLVVASTLLLGVWAYASGRLEYKKVPRARGRAAAFTLDGAPLNKRQRPDGTYAPTLLIYVFSNTDPEYLDNLRFFVTYGIGPPNDHTQYIIVVQDQEGQEVRRAGGAAAAASGGAGGRGRKHALAAACLTSSAPSSTLSLLLHFVLH